MKFENEKVRVLEAELPPGVKEAMHSHPAYVIYVLAGGKVRNYAADGKTTPLALPVGYGDTLAAAQESDGRLAYVLQNRSDGSPGLQRIFGDGHQKAIVEWIRANGRPVDPGLWRAAGEGLSDWMRRGAEACPRGDNARRLPYAVCRIAGT